MGVLHDGGAASLHQFEAASRAFIAGTGIPGQSYILACLAVTYGQAGQPDVGLRVLAEARAVVDTYEERCCAAEIVRLHGALLLQQAQQRPGVASPAAAATAAQHFQQARLLARQQQAKFWELRATMSLARLWRQQGRRAEAYELLAPLYGWFTEGFDTPDLQEARALLEELA